MTAPHARPQFGHDDLSSAERQVVRAAATGALVDLRTGDAPRDDPAGGAAWDAGRTVRATVLVTLLTAEGAPGGGPPRAVRLRGARITGDLDLEAADLPCPLLLEGCRFERPADLRDATARVVRLPGCHLPGLAADRLRTTGELNLDGVTTDGPLGLSGARVGGSLSLGGARLTGPAGAPALRADALTVAGSMWCRDGFTATGEVHMPGARIGGRLSFAGARLRNPGGRALTADGITVEQNLACRDGFTAEGEVRMPGARLGRASFTRAHLTNPGGYALLADGLSVDHTMDCGDGFSTDGEVRLVGARVGGTLSLGGATLTNPGGYALRLDRVTAGQDVFFEHDFTARGEVHIGGAHVRGMLALTGARFVNPGGRALTAYLLTVEQDMAGRDGFVVEGELGLSRAHIGGVLELDGARLVNPGETALSGAGMTVGRGMTCRHGFTAAGRVDLADARLGYLDMSGANLSHPAGAALLADHLIVDENLFCAHGFTADGEVRLVGARVGGLLSFRDAVLAAPSTPREPWPLALDLEGARARELVLCPRRRVAGGVDLTNARAGRFHDDPATMPPGRLGLRGFTYDTLDDEIDVDTRLRWLASHWEGYNRRLYDQLAAVYRRAGHEEAARRVALVAQWRRRERMRPPGRAWNWLLYLTVGYGYRPWLAGLWLAALLALGTGVFSAAYPRDLTRAGAGGPGFHAFGYTLDVLLPIVDLGQQKAWLPHGAAMYWSWAFMAAGWILTTALVAGLTGTLKRD